MQNLKALTEFTVAFELDDTNIGAVYDLGRVYYALKDYQKALIKFLSYYEKRPNAIDNIKRIALCYLHSNDFQNAEIWNNKILQLQPDDENALKVAEKIRAIIKDLQDSD